MVEVVVLPVIRVERAPDDGVTWRCVHDPRPNVVTDLNAFRYARERARVERRSSTSLLPDLATAYQRHLVDEATSADAPAPCDVGGNS